MTAALVAMDDRQGRLDTPGALIRKGDLPESRARSAPRAPVVAARPIVAPAVDQRVVRVVREARDDEVVAVCQQAFDAPRDYAAPLSSELALAFLECERTPRYSTYIDYRVDRRAPGSPQRNILPVPAGALALEMTGRAAPQFDAATGALWVSATLDDEGRCGYRSEWRFDGHEFQLASYREQRVCAGLPFDWPTWYRSSEP